MLGKGGKRKFDEHEDGLEGKVLSPSDGPSKVSYTLQRQTIFNISLMKLYQQRPLSEPSLQRTVLINNMLRRIQDELRREGSLRPACPAPAAAAPGAPPGACRREEAPAPGPAAAPGVPAPLQACLTPASLLEEDSHGGGDRDTFCTPPAAAAAAAAAQPAGPAGGRLPAAPSPARPPEEEEDSFSSALDEIEELCPAPTSAQAAAPRAGAPKPDGPLPPDGRPDEPKLMDSLPGSFEVTTSTGFLTDLTLDDILFADIDTSMYDFDPCTSAAGAAAAAAAAAKVAPVSADDLLKTLAPYSSQPVAPSQPFKMDLTELDHIMEVLVGS